MNVKRTSIIFGVFILISISLLFIFLPSQKISGEDIRTVEVKSETVESGIQMEAEIKEADFFTTTVEYPILEIDNIDKEIKTWITEQENIFYEQLEQISYFFAKKNIANLTIKTDIEKVNNDLYSFTISAEQYIKDKDDKRENKTFVVNLKEKEIIHIEEVLNLNGKHKEILKKAIVQTDTTKSLTEDMIDSKLNKIDQTDWILTKDHLILFFYENNNKKYTSRLDFEKIKKALTKEYEKILLVDNKKKQKKNKKNAKKKEEQKKQKDKRKKVNKNKKLVALTFDDGPDSITTPQILNILEEHNVKATFFMLSNNARKNKKIAKNIVKKGHEIGNHSKSHINLNAVKKSRIKLEIIQSQAEIEEVTGVKTTLFRPPYGEYNQNVINYAAKSDQQVIMWSVDTYDWKSRNRKKIVNEIERQTKSGSIILLHDIHQTTANSLNHVITYLKKADYEFVTVSELLSHIEPSPNGVYYGK